MGDAAERLHANIMSGLEKPLSEKYKDILAPQPAAPAAVQPPVEQVPVNQPVVNQVPDNQVQAVPEAEKVPLNRMPGGLDLGEGAREPHSFRKEMISVDDLMPEEPKKRSGSFVKGKDPANDRKKDAGKAGEKKEDQKEEAKHEEGRRNSARSHKGK